MRRREQEITDKKALEDILVQALVCRIGLADGNVPYIVPVSFGYKDDCIYFHSSGLGRKMELLKKNNAVCFEVDTNVEILTEETACKWSVRYLSVVGFGKAHIVDSDAEKKKGLDALMKHYSGSADHAYDEKWLKLAVVIRIDIESMTGKKSKR